MDRFAIVTGDITASDAEAIVNAANRTLPVSYTHLTLPTNSLV